jgi:hypothetical protein
MASQEHLQHIVQHICNNFARTLNHNRDQQTLPKSHIKAKSVCAVQTAEIAPETVSTEALSRLKDLRNVQNSQKTPSTHTIWHMQRFISHNARQTRSGTQQFSVFTL